MVDKIIKLYKKCGQTPLECINQLKKTNNLLINTPITYAGRLDPLAEGVLIALTGKECLNKDIYLALPKEYELTVLFGFSTDTYDLMGKVEDKISQEELFERSSDFLAKNFKGRGQTISNSSSYFISKIQKVIPKFIGIIDQPYPVYSSRTVKGKPLFKWAREGRLNEIEIPSHKVRVDNIEIIKEGQINSKALLKKIKNIVGLVNGDFRQDEIISIWKKILSEKNQEYKTLKLKVSCGSGVYVRSIAHELGQMLGLPALAFKIVRTKVGNYSIKKL